MQAENNQSVTARFWLFCDDNDLNVWYDQPSALIHHFAHYTWSNLSTTAAGPTIVSQPLSKSVIEGTAASLQVLASGTEPLSYQWQKDGQDIPNATGHILVFSNVELSDQGSYRVLVRNGAGGSKLSTPAQLTVNAALPPVFNGQPEDLVGFVGELAYTRVSLSSPTANGQPIYPFDVQVRLEWTRDGKVLATSQGTFGSLNSLFNPGSVTDDRGFHYLTKADTGTYYAVGTIRGSSASSNPFSITVVDENDAPAFRINRKSFNATAGTGVTLVMDVVGTQDKDGGGRGKLNSATYQWKKDGQVIPGATLPYLDLTNLQASDDGAYTVVATVVSGASAESDPVRLNLTEPCAPPAAEESLRGKLYSMTPSENSPPGTFPAGVINVRFAATGNNYEVVDSTGTAIYSGTWTAKLSFGSFTITLAGFKFTDRAASASLLFYCNEGALGFSLSRSTAPFSSIFGSAATKLPPVELAGPVITAQPAAVTINVGQTATFTVAATVADNSTLTYQWKKGETAIPGATSATYTIPAAGASDAGSYKVQVTANGKSVSSSPARLTVLSGPVITRQPEAKTVLAGQAATLGVEASGNGALTYQWLKGGALIPGAVTPTLSIRPVRVEDAGAYTVEVTSLGQTSTSAPASLAVDTAGGRQVELSAPTTNAQGQVEVTVRYTATGTETSVTVTLDYNRETMTDALAKLAPTLPAGTTLAMDAAVPGKLTAKLTLPSGSKLAVGLQDLVTARFTPQAAAGFLGNLAALAGLEVSATVTEAGGAASAVPVGFNPIVGPLPTVTAANLLTGTSLFETTIRVTNPGRTTVGMKVLVKNLGNDSQGGPIKLDNATDPSANPPYIVVPVNAGGYADVVLDFAVADRKTVPNPSYEVSVVPFIVPPILIDPTASMDAAKILPPSGRDLAQGMTVTLPTVAGRSYFMQYSHDGGRTWNTSLPIVKGTTGGYSWLDNGYPRTPSKPIDTASRIYRLIAAP